MLLRCRIPKVVAESSFFCSLTWFSMQQEIPEEKVVQAALKQVSGGIGETGGVACAFAEEEG